MSLLFAAASAVGWKTFFFAFISRWIFSLVVFMSFTVYTLRIYFCDISTHTHNFHLLLLKIFLEAFSLIHSCLLYFFVSHFFIIMIFLRFVFALRRTVKMKFFCEQKSSFYRSVRSYNFIKCNNFDNSISYTHICGEYGYGFENGEKNENTQSQLKFLWLYFSLFYIYFLFRMFTKQLFYLYSIVVLYA